MNTQKLYLVLPHYNTGAGFATPVNILLATFNPADALEFARDYAVTTPDITTDIFIFAQDVGEFVPPDVIKTELASNTRTSQHLVFHRWKPTSTGERQWLEQIHEPYALLAGEPKPAAT